MGRQGWTRKLFFGTPSVMTTIAIACPYPLDAKMGNVVTANRLSGILKEIGYEPRLCHGWNGETSDALLVLNAVKGAKAARDYHEAYPERPIIVLLTGTDLYRDLHDESNGGTSTLIKASRIVVMTDRARSSLSQDFEGKTVVIPQSLEVPRIEDERVGEVFGMIVLGHLRPVKNPFHLVGIVARHPEWTDVRVWQVGAALSREMTAQALEWEAKDDRYDWCAELPREEGLRLLKRSRLLVNSSRLEGAPSAILEAMHFGVPVLASRVEGNIGLLGEDYEGYFDPENEAELEELLGRAREQPGFLDQLQSRGRERCVLFSREREIKGWKALLAGL